MELQTNRLLEGTGMGLEVALALLQFPGLGVGTGPQTRGLYMRQPTSPPWVSHSLRGHCVPWSKQEICHSFTHSFAFYLINVHFNLTV